MSQNPVFFEDQIRIRFFRNSDPGKTHPDPQPCCKLTVYIIQTDTLGKGGMMGGMDYCGLQDGYPHCNSKEIFTNLLN